MRRRVRELKWVPITCTAGYAGRPSGYATEAQFFLKTISTRLFFCRPSGLSAPSAGEFDAISLDFPSPRVVNRDAGYAQRLYNIAASEYDVFAQKGDAAAQNTLAGMYENAKGVKADNAMALFWYKKAALQDYALAQYNIGRLLMEHASSERTVAEAAYWLDLAAAQGLREAETMLVQIKQQYGTSIASR